MAHCMASSNLSSSQCHHNLVGHADKSHRPFTCFICFKLTWQGTADQSLPSLPKPCRQQKSRIILHSATLQKGMMFLHLCLQTRGMGKLSRSSILAQWLIVNQQAAKWHVKKQGTCNHCANHCINSVSCVRLPVSSQWCSVMCLRDAFIEFFAVSKT